MKKQPKKKLTPKQKRFVAEYIVDLNATQAAIRAGYSEKTANRIASENLSKPVIQEAIQKQTKKINDKLEITAERVLLERARLAFHNNKDLFHQNGTLKQLHELDDDVAAAIHGVKIGARTITDDEGNEQIETYIRDVKTYDKDKSLTALEKYLGIYEKDNEQKRTDLDVLKDLAQAIDGATSGLPKPRKP